MYHSVTFGEKNTWDDWRIVPATRPLFDPPPQKVKTVDVPGGDGLIDLSQALSGRPVFQNRTGSMEFIVMNDFRPWQIAYSDILAYLHGQRMRAVLEDDPGYFYEGRFTVNAWKSEKDWSRIVIDYSVEPYKRSLESSLDPWKWDPFNFQNGVILSALCKDIPVDTTPASRFFPRKVFGLTPVSPIFHVRTTAGRGVHATLADPFFGTTIDKYLPEGVSAQPEFIFFGTEEEPAELRLSCAEGTGKVSLEFRPGRL